MHSRIFLIALFCLSLLFALRSARAETGVELSPALLNPVRQAARQAQGMPVPLPEKEEERWRAWHLLPPGVQAKVDPRILAEFRGEVRPAHLGGNPDQQALQPAARTPLAQTRFLVYLQKQADFTTLSGLVFASQVQQRSAVFSLLTDHAQQEQAALRSWLESRLGTAVVTGYQPFVIVNAIAVDGSLESVMTLAQRPDVARLVANYPLVKQWQEPLTPVPSDPPDPTVQPAAVGLDPSNWNIELVRADRVWNELRVRGEGAVVAGFDTGVAFRHPALVKQYRGNLQNGRFDHNYHWFEPDGQLYPNGNLGKSLSAQPRDCDTHGTHTMGTSVGDGGSSGTQVGMAPGAQWIAIPGICYGTMSGGIRDDIGGLKAFQWLLCPTNLSGDLTTADCAKAPDVVNNSWGSANPTNDVLRPAIQALRAMNIAPVFASGNPRAGAGSIGTPANAPEAITVGATDSTDRVAPFSGRGPSFYEGEQKPELSAPGVNVKSTIVANGYEAYSGTSMAAPHVSGLIALMVSADLRDGRRDFTVDELETFMMNTAIDLGQPGPDDDYGYGRIDAYQAVRWVLSAGDLRGSVRNQVTNTPIALANVTGAGGNTTFHGQSNAAGAYSVTVPAGSYNLVVDAWGYYSGTFADQSVLTGALAQANFALRPLPTATVQGIVRNNGVGVVNALIYVEAQPILRERTDSNGQYRFTLPIGRHTLVVQEPGYRIQRTAITVGATGTTQDLVVESVPSILLVEADAYRGWFEGWPIGNVFTWALDQQGYAYDRWRIQSVTITDTTTLADGSLVYGVPSVPTLKGYDVVIWAQSGCDSGYFGCFYRSSPVAIGADNSLQAYLDGGGRLILSGQDIGIWDDGTPFYDQYLNADLLLENAAKEGERVIGSSFLESVALTLTNASLYGYRNGSIALSPDAITAERMDAATYPILRYTQSQNPAALAIDPCNADYRAVYFGIGFENIGPRAANRDPAIADVLGRTVRWVSDAKRTHGFELLTDQTTANVEPGRSMIYNLQLINTGRTAITLQLTASAVRWPTRILSGGQELTQPLSLAPCQTIPLTIRVTPPSDTLNGEQTTLVITTAALTDPSLTREITLKTVAFAAWQTEKALPTSRYHLGVVAPPNDIYLYAVGGWRNEQSLDPNTTERTSAAVDRYNVCTQQWESLANLPGSRANVGMGLLNGQIYVVGGSSSIYDFGFYDYRQHASVFVYNLAGNQWSEVASLPKAYAGMTVAAANGRLYAFGGIDENSAISNQTYEYNPASNLWVERAPMPGGARYLAAAATWNGEIYVAGGWDSSAVVEIYNPATNTWRTGPALQRGRHSLGLTAAPDGYLYAVGGAVSYAGEGSVERYSPTTNTWERLNSLNDSNRFGTAAAYAGGRLYAVGGAGVLQSVEGLRIDTSFCLSEQRTAQRTVGIGNPISYTVTLYADAEARPNAGYVHPLPPQTTFGGFTQNEIGARFNPTTRQIEWHGALDARAAPKGLSYLFNTDTATLTDGDLITSTAQFNNGAGLVFTRTTVTLVLAADLSSSTKRVDRAEALAGEMMTYTVQIQGATFVGGEVMVSDPLPATVAYIPDTLTYSSGSGRYDAASHSILWAGHTQAGPDAYLNLTERYSWGDSDGKGEIPTTPYAWVEIGETGAALNGGDAEYTCGLPIGFGFPFYGVTETEFCVSTNGFVSFQQDGIANDSNDCPLPTTYGNAAVIAAVWDDLYVEKDIRYQTLGAAPNRHLVVQWNGVRRYGAASSKLATFQVALFENGVIRVAIQEAGSLRGASSTTGIEDHMETTGVTYACNQNGTLHNQQAVVFVPPGVGTGATRADIHFQVRSTSDLGVNAPITNTVIITTPTATFQRQAATLMNSVKLHTSAAQVNNQEVGPGEHVVYRVDLRNTGLFTATNATLTFAVPAAMRYVDDSINCSDGACQHDNGVIRWSGRLAPRLTTTLVFTLRLTTGLPDLTPISLIGQLDDGYGNRYELPTSVLARRSDLRLSQLQMIPAFVEPGESVGVHVSIYNVGGFPTNAAFQMRIPIGLRYVADSLACGDGSCTYADDLIQWSGPVGARTVVPLRFRLATSADATYGDVFTATATVSDSDWNESYSLTATVTIAHNFYLSIIQDPGKPFQTFLPFVYHR